MLTYLQVIFALAIVIILFVIGFAIYNYEYLNSLRAQGVTKEKVVIFDGVMDLSTSKDMTYNTVDPKATNYKKIGPSFNQAGGIEFTYNFWMHTSGALYTGNTDPSPISDNGLTTGNIGTQTILFVKGNKVPTKYMNICNTEKEDIEIKCPLVKLENNGKNLTVEFNTLTSKDAVVENSPDVCSEYSNKWDIKNAHKLTIANINQPALLDQWNMFTIVLQDTFPQDPLPYRNKVRCRIYLNAYLEFDKYVDGKLPKAGDYNSNEPSVLRPNQSNLIIAPTVSVGSPATSVKLPATQNILRLANMTYFNYAVTQEEIDSMIAAGVDQRPPTTTVSNTGVAGASKRSVTS